MKKIKIMHTPTLHRSLSIIFYIICLTAAIGCFYFTIFGNVFAWLVPDELGASQGCRNLGGVFHCAIDNYLHGTIDRLSAAFAICLMAKGSLLASTPFMGWVFARFIFYMLVPISIAFLLRTMTQISLKFSLCIAFIISAMATCVMINVVSYLFGVAGYFDVTHYLFGIDLAIYGTATITFFILIALFFRSVESDRYFIGFCFVYLLSLNSHEVLLVIDGLFIPLYAWYYYSRVCSTDHSVSLFIKSALQNKRVWILLAIYCISACLMIFAPSTAIRQVAWPATGTFFEGVVYVLLLIEEAIYFITKAGIFVILIFLLGAVFRLFMTTNKALSTRHNLFCAFLFSIPWLYLCVIGFLIGVTPTLWTFGIRTEAFRQVEPFLTNFFTNQVIFNRGGLPGRQELFFYTSFFVDIFLAGFFIAGVVRKRMKESIVAKTWVPTFALLLVGVGIFLLHLNGVSGMRTLFAFFKNKIDLAHYAPLENKTNPWHTNIVSFFASDSSAIQAFGRMMFPFFYISSHKYEAAAAVNIAADQYLKANRGKVILTTPLDFIYAPDIPDGGKQQECWDIIYSLYHVLPRERCVSFLTEPGVTSECYGTVGAAALTKLLAQKKHPKMVTATPIDFTEMHGLAVKNRMENCIQLAETVDSAEHFVMSKDLQLSKGLYYFLFEGQPTKAELHLFLLGEKNNLLFSWFNQPHYLPSRWSKDETGHLQPIFTQVEASQRSEKFKIVIYSAINQKIRFRWQHGMRGTPANYQGKKENISSICKAEFGQIIDGK